MVRKVELKVVSPKTAAEAPAEIPSKQELQKKIDSVSVDASPAKFKEALRNMGRAFADVTLPPELEADLQRTFASLKPPKKDLYKVLCQHDPELAKEVGPADLALMDKMLKSV